jgi:quercetin dioxygenase-like cupin family protein
MNNRSPALQHFIDSVRLAIADGGDLPESGEATARHIFAALEANTGTNEVGDPARLPACANLTTAFENARQGPLAAARLGKALAAIEPLLTWRNKHAANPRLAARHASTVVVGPEGVERRDDVKIGVSLMAANTIYPDHNHPPEEIYAVLSTGAWRQNDKPWHEPGPGGLVYNPANVSHAMRALDAPLLAVWSLWLKG